MNRLWQDVQYALRTWIQNPGMAIVALFSLTLGIGANTTIFSVINSVRQHELEFKDTERLTVLWDTNVELGIQQRPPSYETVAAIAEHGQSFESFGFVGGGTEPVTVSGTGEAGRVHAQPVELNIFSVLGVQPVLGRGFIPEDAKDLIKQKEVRSVVISHGTWQRRFGGASDVIGRTLTIDGKPRPVLGVMPPGFTIVPWIDDVALWTANDLSRIPKARWMIPIGRLKPGVTAEQAQAEAGTITRRLIASQGEKEEGWDSKAESLHQAYFGGLEDGLLFLLATVGFVLLIACTNVANLLLARGAARQKELTIRASVGAGRGVLVRQLLTESVILALAGGVFGAAFAIWGNRIFAALLPGEFPDFMRELSIDFSVLGFTLVVSVLTGLLFGLLPAQQASKLNLVEALKDGGRQSGTASGNRGRSFLLIAEVALAMVLLIGAGLMMKGFLTEQNADPGFNAENLLTSEVLLGGDKYFEKIPGDKNRVTSQCALFYDQVLEGIRALPGVKSAGMISRLPFGVQSQPFTVAGRPAPEPGEEPRADFNEIDSELFQTLEMPLLRGRYLTNEDAEGTAWVAVVNRTMADRYFSDEDPIGQSIQVTMRSNVADINVREQHTREIVGVVSDFKYPGFFEEKPAAVYVPHWQHPSEYGSADHWAHIRKTLVIRAAVEPMLLAEPVRRVITQVDPDQAAHDLMTMERRIANSVSVVQSRFLAQLFGIFGGLAILLAVIGIYGVTSYYVSQRTHEFGIRMAVGAGHRDVIKLVLRRVLKPTLIGVAIGAGAGVGVSKLLSSVFFRLTTADPLTFGAVAVLMVGAALAAGYFPALRAVKVDPLQALRYQ